MIFPGDKIDYREITDSFIADKAFSSTIWENISFVEKYVLEVEKTFKDENERKIVYRQLASIACSCIEAVSKSVLFNINEHCKKRDCSETCEYNKKFCTLKKLNRFGSQKAFNYLFDVGLIWFFPGEIYEFDVLNDMRNNIHLSKSIGVSKPDTDFDADLVKRTIDYFYGLLAQLYDDIPFFKDEKACLKNKDNDNLVETREKNEDLRKKYFYREASASLHLLFLGYELGRNEKWTVKKFSEKFEPNELSQWINYLFALYSRSFQNKQDYQNALNEYFVRLSKYLDEDYLNKVRNSYNEIKKQTENKQ